MKFYIILILSLGFTAVSNAQTQNSVGINVTASFTLTDATHGNQVTTASVKPDEILKLANVNPCFQNIVGYLQSSSAEFAKGPELKDLTDTFGPVNIVFKYDYKGLYQKKSGSTFTQVGNSDLIAFLDFPQLQLYNQQHDIPGSTDVSESVSLKGSQRLDKTGCFDQKGSAVSCDGAVAKRIEIYNTDDLKRCETAAKQAFANALEKAKAAKVNPASALSLLAGRMKAVKQTQVREPQKKINAAATPQKTIK